MGERELCSVTGFAPVNGRYDWYWLSLSMAKILGESPQVVWIHGRPMAHLSQLPLLRGYPVVEAAMSALGCRTSDTVRAVRDVVTSGKGFRLRDYQHDAIDFIRARRGTLLADQMRLGKSAVAAASHDPAEGPLVVTGPLAVREVWAREFARRWPDAKAVFLTGREYDRSAFEGADLIFVHYDVIHAWYSLIRMEPATFIIDEAHLLSNGDSNRSTATSMIAAKAKRVIALTGTPLWNKPLGLFPVLSIVADRGFGGWFDFARRYCNIGQGDFMSGDGLSNEDELRDRLTPIMLRRVWTDVAQDLPPITRNIVKVEITSSERRNVEMLAEAARGMSSTDVGDMARLRRCVGTLKIPKAQQIARDLLDCGEPVVVWTWHKMTARKIADAIVGRAVLVTGDMSANDRAKVLEAWRTDHEPTALVITMGVGQAGIDLSHARHAVFAEVDFTPAVIGQAEFRTYSPLRSMVVTYLCVDHPVENRLISILVEKCATAQRVGIPASESAEDMWREVVDDRRGAYGEGDLSRLRQAFLDESDRGAL